MPVVLQTTPPGKYILLYDGHCPFCRKQSKNLQVLARPGTLVTSDFQEPGVLERFPALSHDACMKAMHLVMPDGRVFRGVEAAVRAIATRRVIGWLAYLYYLPGFRQLCDALYAFLAAHRYQFWGRTLAQEQCEHGACSVHFPPSDRPG
jgi:predicted DCC family thiol-disulfide oxidoreductase YuxK